MSPFTRAAPGFEANFCSFDIQGNAVALGAWRVDHDGTITGPDELGHLASLGHVLETPTRDKPWSYWIAGVHKSVRDHPEFMTRRQAVETALLQCASLFGEKNEEAA